MAPLLSFQNLLPCLCRLSFPAPFVLVVLHPVFPGGVLQTPAPPSWPAPGVPATGPGGWDWCAPGVGVPARWQYRPGLDRPPPRPLSVVVRWNLMGRACTAAQCQHAQAARTRVSPWRVGHAWEGSFRTAGAPTRDIPFLLVDGGSRPLRGTVKVEDGRKAHRPCLWRPAVATVRLPLPAVSIWRQARENNNKRKNADVCARRPLSSDVQCPCLPLHLHPGSGVLLACSRQWQLQGVNLRLFFLFYLACLILFIIPLAACRSLLPVRLRALFREPILAGQAHPRAGACTNTPPAKEVGGCKGALHLCTRPACEGFFWVSSPCNLVSFLVHEVGATAVRGARRGHTNADASAEVHGGTTLGAEGIGRKEESPPPQPAVPRCRHRAATSAGSSSGRTR